MAVLDPERNAIVLRIVYDGPPHAGKTTSVRSLARSLMRSVETPLESAGRTVYFDWMEYTGGSFEGHQIRCQIVSVPGQPDLVARRRALLETADVVVFVADTSTATAVARSVAHIRQMVAIVRGHAELPVGVIVQANKRDVPGAISRDELCAALGNDFARTAVTESVAGLPRGPAAAHLGYRRSGHQRAGPLARDRARRTARRPHALARPGPAGAHRLGRCRHGRAGGASRAAVHRRRRRIQPGAPRPALSSITSTASMTSCSPWTEAARRT
jgi:signal recognition particle receptor subunit beta